MANEKKLDSNIAWMDLTVPNADEVKEFYSTVTGWKPEGFDMGGYEDFVMKIPSTGEAITGICNTKGSNASFPSQWLIYINVQRLDESIEHCNRLGGKVIVEPKTMPGQGKYCVIQDPAGAVCALFEQIEKE